MNQTTITIPAGSSLDIELERVAETTEHSKEDVALGVLVSWREDHADMMSAQAIASREEPTTSLADMRKEFGLNFSRTAKRQFI